MVRVSAVVVSSLLVVSLLLAVVSTLGQETLDCAQCAGDKIPDVGPTNQTIPTKDWFGCPDDTYKRKSKPEGGFICVKCTIEQLCGGYLDSQKQWKCCPPTQIYKIDDDTMTGSCCDPLDEFVIDKKNSPQGACCPKGHSYHYSPLAPAKGACCAIGHAFSFDEKSKTGFCCPTEMIWDGAVCSPPPSKPPTEPPTDPVGPGSCPNDCPGPIPPVQPSWCQQRKVCPTSCRNIGLKYGHCYTITYPDGDGLNRHNNDEYKKGAQYIDDITFRVCTVQRDCNFTDKSLTREDGFLLRDEKGVSSKSSDNKGWVYSPGIGAHFNYRSDADLAAGPGAVAGEKASGIVPFVGKPSCFGDGCSICLSTQIKEGRGLGLVCPVEEMHAIGATRNGNMCQRLVFYEIKCDDADCPVATPASVYV